MPRSAGWGAACESCAAAKARCLRSDETPGANCDRCRSLERSCTPRMRKPRKRRQSKEPQSSRSEKRLNGLIESPKQSETPSHSPRMPPERATFEIPERRQDETSANHSLPGFNTFARPTCTCQQNICSEDPNPVASDETLFSIYNSRLRSQFPFVIIPPGMSMAQLQQSRPFLTKVIRMVASIQCRRAMWAQSRTVLQHIADAAIMRSERSLDLLQGMLVFLGYYHYFCLAHGQFHNLAHLIISMIGDMGLDRRIKPHQNAPYVGMDPDEPKTTSNEERRAVVGAWYMASNAALSFNKLESPRFTKHHDQCLSELEDAAEYETDDLLVQLVRIQHLTERIFHFNHRDQLMDVLVGATLSETAVAAQISAFQGELDGIENSLPKKLKSNYLLLSHYRTARLRLHEQLLSDANPSGVALSSPLTLPILDAQAFHRYHAATSVLRFWVDNWLAIPVSYYFHMPQPGYGHLLYAVTILARQARLSLLASAQPNYATSTPSNVSIQTAQDAANDIDAQATEAFVLNALETFVARFEAARVEIGAAYGQEWENDLLDQIANTLRIKKARIVKWSSVLRAAMNDGPSGDVHPPVRDWPAVSAHESSTEAMKAAGEWSFEPLGRWLQNDNYQESWLWGSGPWDML